MQILSSVSGGKSSAFVLSHYPSDINIFSLVRIESPHHKWMQGKDEKTRSLISQRLDKEFIGTFEMDSIIYTILDLEQYTGKEIKFVTGCTFEEMIIQRKGYLPNATKRFCTTHLKIDPIYDYLYFQSKLPVYTLIGYRYGEENRQDSMLKKVDESGFLTKYVRLAKKPNSRYYNRDFVQISKPLFPLIYDSIDSNYIDNYWSRKSIRFADFNNCATCVNRSPLFLNYLSKNYEYEYSKGIYLEKFAQSIYHQRGIYAPTTFRFESSLEKIANPKIDFGLFASDFNDCDSGICGL